MRLWCSKTALVACLILLLRGVAIAQFQVPTPSDRFETARLRAIDNHHLLLRQYGGTVQLPELVTYVDRIGQSVVEQSELVDKPFVFTVLNTPLVNAFTVGGGFVYITRGLLAVMNDEAELAAVLAHEVGHMTAGHTANREAQTQWTAYETQMMARAAKSWEGMYTQALQGQAKLMRYSRDQERAADAAGFTTLTKLGYDPNGLSHAIASMQRFVDLRTQVSGQNQDRLIPAWLQDHPTNAERMRTARERAAAVTAGQSTPLPNHQDAYLDAIEGLPFGEDANFGTVVGQKFYHTALDFSLDAPSGLMLRNTPQAIIGQRGSELTLKLAGMHWPRDQTLRAYAQQLWRHASQNKQGAIDEFAGTRINGIEAARARKQISYRNSGNRRSTLLDIQTAIYRLHPTTVVHLTFITDREHTASQQRFIDAMIDSLRRLTEEERQHVRPRTLRLIHVRPGDDLTKLASQMDVQSHRHLWLQTLNNVSDDSSLQERKRLKIIRYQASP